jgi:hypothetical protein
VSGHANAYMEQVLRVMEYSRLSRHLLLTAGDDGTVHLWDSTARSPKAGLLLFFLWLLFFGSVTAAIILIQSGCMLSNFSCPLSVCKTSFSSTSLVGGPGEDVMCFLHLASLYVPALM